MENYIFAGLGKSTTLSICFAPLLECRSKDGRLQQSIHMEIRSPIPHSISRLLMDFVKNLHPTRDTLHTPSSSQQLDTLEHI